MTISINAQTECIDSMRQIDRFYIYHSNIFSGSENMQLRNALKPIRTHRALATTSSMEFTKGTIPNLSFLCDSQIGNGITYTIEKPILRSEYQCFIKAIEFYCTKLKTLIEQYYVRLEQLQTVVDVRINPSYEVHNIREAINVRLINA